MPNDFEQLKTSSPEAGRKEQHISIENIYSVVTDQRYLREEQKDEAIRARALISESQDAAKDALNLVLENLHGRSEMVIDYILSLLELNPSLENYLNMDNILPKVEAAICDRMLYDLKWNSILNRYKEKLPNLSKFKNLAKIFTDAGLKIIRENPKKSSDLILMLDSELSENLEKNPEWHNNIRESMTKCGSYNIMKQLAEKEGVPLEELLNISTLNQSFVEVLKRDVDTGVFYSSERMNEIGKIIRLHPEGRMYFVQIYIKTLKYLLLDWHQYETKKDEEKRQKEASEILDNTDLNEFRSEFINQLHLSNIQNLLNRGFLHDEDITSLDIQESTQEKVNNLLSQFNSNNHYSWKEDKLLVMFCVDNFPNIGKRLARVLIENASSDRPILNLNNRNFIENDQESLKRVWKKSGLSYQNTFNHDSATKEILLKLAASLASRGVSALDGTDIFQISDDFLKTAEVQQAAATGIAYSVSSSSYITDEPIKNVLKLRDKFLIPQDRFVQAVEAGALRFIKQQTGGMFSGIDGFRKIISNINLTPGFLSSDDLSEWGINCIVEIRSKYSHHEAVALEIREKFGLSISVENILRFVPSIKKLLDDMQEIAPEFVNQAMQSTDLLFSLAEFKDNPDQFFSIIKEYPFLLDAVAGNRRFGSRLLVFYHNFDEISRNNIQAQFAFKKEILIEHPEMDPESLEFRQAMQEKLKKHGRNTKIIATAEEKGVNMEQWLNYEETRNFRLESGDSVLAFSETIAMPIRRIKETIDSFAYTIKDVLKEYRQELSNHEILLEDPKEIDEKIAAMSAVKEKATTKKNDKKAEGIQKGIDNLTQKRANLKKGKLWDKLLSDVASFQRLKDDVFGAHEELIKAEAELSKVASEKAPSGKAVQEIKRKISAAKENLRGKLTTLERRIENFKVALPEMLSPVLGKERTESLTQDIDTRLAEQFSHYDADRTTLLNLFAGQAEKQKEELESRPMSIFVWAHNPDIDLYQGNYSPCCICIDSTHMGAESTIADYNTDLGVQIVNIWDETKNEPVTAAWCWLGKDRKGEPALVVDNIESNTLYSANYSELLTKELFRYLEMYAKKIGVNKVVLGKANNDLPTAGELSKMKENKGIFTKLGGANRKDGYFLEAEEASVKVVWEKGQPSKKREKRETKPRLKKAEYLEVNIKNLDENLLPALRALERKVYEREDADLIRGQALVQDIVDKNGLKYSVSIWGKAKKNAEPEMIGYIAAIEDETDEGNASIYLDDIAVSPEAQRQGVGWKILEGFIQKLKLKANSEHKPVLLDMHLRPNSQAFMEKHKDDLKGLGVNLIEEALVVDYYDEGEDAVYQVYEVSPDES